MEYSPRCRSHGLGIESNSLGDKQVDEISLRTENKLSWKMKDEIKKSKKNHPKSDKFPVRELTKQQHCLPER